ncbi:MAG: TetR/AcrR family transcriptional regulator [Terricaulis sp.]
MASSPRSKPKFEAKRAAILNAAMQILYRRGVAGMTLSAVAQSVGLNTPGVTYYFPRKDDLAAACYLVAIERLDELLTRASRIASAKRRFREVFAGMFAWHQGIRRGDQHEFVPFADMRALEESNRTVVEAAFAQMAKKARALFEGAEFARLESAERRARGHLLLEHLFWVMSWLYEFDVEDYPRVLERTCDLYLYGLRDGDNANEFDFAEKDLELDVETEGKEEFLVAATRALNNFGYWGASVERISASLNATKGAFYHHNMSKDELVISCFHRSFDLSKAAQMNAMHRDGSAWEMLKFATCALAEFQLSERGPLLRQYLLSSVPEELRHKVSGRANRITNRYVALISDGAKDGSLRLVDAQIASQMLRVTINAIAAGPLWVKGITRRQAPRLYLAPAHFGALWHAEVAENQAA